MVLGERRLCVATPTTSRRAGLAPFEFAPGAPRVSDRDTS